MRTSRHSAYGEVCQLAQNLARNCGYAVFPCSERKTPTRRKEEGGQGHKDASTDPEIIEFLWRHWPGPLIGVATGAVSGLVVLDLDVKHDPARAWWQTHGERMPETRSQRTCSDGVHFHFLPSLGIRCNVGRDNLVGVDVRGEGGYVIHWFAAGLRCLDQSPPAPWPAWLTKAVLPPAPRPAERRAYITTHSNADAAITGILQKVSQAQEGSRNTMLNWAAYRMGERVLSGQIGRGEAEKLLAEAARACGLTKIPADRTIASGLNGAGA
ncbi:MAG TPA: bifunctional DNA primase/polymerase [Acetobacteraceae bacterium]|nr:bifunctional DNA primase/polymerase [Acetobacteraceae bacterium]